MSGPISPMLATKGAPPAGPGWAFEFKWDGIRSIADTADRQLRLSTREGHNVTDNYPELAELIELLDGRPVVLDGEIVALTGGTDGCPRHPSLQALQGRLGRTRQLAAWMRDVPVYYHVFDVLRIDGVSVMNQPYIERRRLLDGLALPTADAHVLVPPNMTEPADWPAGHSFAAALLGVADAHRLEGVVAKKMTSIYQPNRRSRNWIKTRLAEWRP